MRSLVGVVVVALVLASCKKPGTVIGSCDRRASDTRESFCSDAFENAPIMSTCDGKRSTSACDRKGALAGCEKAEGIRKRSSRCLRWSKKSRLGDHHQEHRAG